MKSYTEMKKNKINVFSKVEFEKKKKKKKKKVIFE